MERNLINNIDTLYNPYELSWGEEIEFPSTRNLDEYGNRIFNRYPARSVFMVPRAILAQHKDRVLNVLDPFMGSGTTAVETVISGNIPYGLEMDPFARMVAEVSSSIYNEEEIAEIVATNKKICQDWESFNPERIPNLTGIERWFKNDDLEKLLKLKSAIISLADEKYRNFFLVTFADAIKPVSLMERQSLKPYISTKFTKETKDVGESFSYSFNAHLSSLIAMSSTQRTKQSIRWIGNDATDFDIDGLIDIAISSPPYINALDYTRCIKIESSLCGTLDNNKANQLRMLQVGHERRRNQDINTEVCSHFDKYFKQILEKDGQRAQTSLAYFNDIYKNLQCVYKALKDKGEYHVIIGDNTIRNIDIPTHSIITELAKTIGFNVFGYYKYIIKDHRTSIPRNKEKNKIKYEHVIMLRKNGKKL